MAVPSHLHVGIDVGERRHHVAVVDEQGKLVGDFLSPSGHSHDDVLELVISLKARIRTVGIDAPCALAADGDRSRLCERVMQRQVGCRIFPTPDSSSLDGHWCEGWIRAGLRLYASLRAELDATLCEVFPTASYTAWSGPRPASMTKTAWSDTTLREQGHLRGTQGSLPRTWNQHQRDALAAAWTARDVHFGSAREIGRDQTDPGIWVPAVSDRDDPGILAGR